MAGSAAYLIEQQKGCTASFRLAVFLS
jgi:hypothetical protein